jgi:hypothetical protein
MPTAIDAACDALGAAKTASESSPIITSPDSNFPGDRCNRPRFDDLSAVLYPSGSRSAINLSEFWFVALVETGPIESWFLFMVSLHIKSV